MTIAVVTDSSAALPGEIAQRHGVHVVPLAVIVEGDSYEEGVDITPDAVAQQLRDGRVVRTSRPSPEQFDRLYADLAGRGFTGAVSVHLSEKMSGTYDAACVAADRAPLDVRTIDSETLGMAMGFAALAAERAAADGAGLEQVAQVAREVAESSATYFCVDDLAYLRRGGRIGKTSAALGSALAIKPVLQVSDAGQVEPFERVRTFSRALTRLADLAVEHAESIDGPVEVSVQHLDARERAEGLLERLGERIDDARQMWLVEIGAALGAHCGPGTIGVSVTARA